MRSTRSRKPREEAKTFCQAIRTDDDDHAVYCSFSETNRAVTNHGRHERLGRAAQSCYENRLQKGMDLYLVCRSQGQKRTTISLISSRTASSVPVLEGCHQSSKSQPQLHLTTSSMHIKSKHVVSSVHTCTHLGVEHASQYSFHAPTLLRKLTHIRGECIKRQSILGHTSGRVSLRT